MSELVPLAGIRRNGELDLSGASNRDLAGMVADVKEAESLLRELKLKLSDEIHRRMDHDRCWTIRTEDGYRLTGQSDAPKVEWDGQGLNEELAGLQADGLISLEAWDRAVTVEEIVKVHVGGLNALLKNPEIAERLAPYRRLVPVDTRRVSLSRSGTIAENVSRIRQTDDGGWVNDLNRGEA